MDDTKKRLDELETFVKTVKIWLGIATALGLGIGGAVALLYSKLSAVQTQTTTLQSQINGWTDEAKKTLAERETTIIKNIDAAVASSYFVSEKTVFVTNASPPKYPDALRAPQNGPSVTFDPSITIPSGFKVVACWSDVTNNQTDLKFLKTMNFAVNSTGRPVLEVEFNEPNEHSVFLRLHTLMKRETSPINP